MLSSYHWIVTSEVCSSLWMNPWLRILNSLYVVIIIINNNNNNNNRFNFYYYKKYVLSNSESVQCNFFIFDYVTFIQFKICCCVQNFMKIGWFFTEIWRCIDFQNGGRPPSWNCFTTIRDHPRSLLLAAVACQISCQCDTQIWRFSYLNFSHIWLEMPIQAPKMGVLAVFGPLNVIIHNRDPQRAHPCVNPRLLIYQL